jgi:hypothetical protein
MDARRTSRSTILGIAAWALMGCGSDDLLDSTFIEPTEIAVDPTDFLGDVVCSTAGGSARAYVVSLFTWDSSSDATPFPLGSSQASSCATVTGFRDVLVVGERYSAQIDVYDVPPESLTPFGSSSSGARQMLSTSSGEVVVPRWDSQCGGGASTAAIAEQDRRVFVRPCDALTADDGTQLSISGAAILGDDPCSLSPSFDVTFQDPTMGPLLDVACDADAIVLDVAPEKTLVMHADYTIDGVSHGATCLATPKAGTVAQPTCEAFTTLGNVRLDVSGLVDDADAQLCPAGASFDVFDTDQTLNTTPLPCTSPATVGPFESGIVTFDVSVYDAAGIPTGQPISCAADVEPGWVVDAVCVPSG